ncbi:MAG: YfhO family protein [Patescibacteria group bacterium]
MSRILAFFRRGPVVAVIIFAGVTLFLFGPVLRGYVPLGVGYLSKILPVITTDGPEHSLLHDSLVQAYPYHVFTNAAIRQGKLPLWNPLIFAGTPFFANGQAAVLSPLKALFWSLPPAVSFTFSILGQFLLGGLGLYVCAGAWGWRRSSRILAGLAYVLSAPFVLWSTTSIMSAVAAWLPWLVWAIQGLHRTLAWRWVVGIALLTMATFFSGQVQIGLLVMLVSGIWAVAFWQRNQWQKRLGLFTIAFVLGIGLSAIQLLPIAEASRYAYRQPAPARWSQLVRPSVLFNLETRNLRAFATLADPNILGNAKNFRGPANYLEGNLYIGPVVLLLAMLSFAAWRRRLWWVAASTVAVVGVFIAFPTLKGLLISQTIPPLALATVWRFSFFLTFGAAILAGLGAEILGQRFQHWGGRIALAALVVVGLWQWQHVLPFGPRADLYPTSPILEATAQATTTGRLWSRDSDLSQYMAYGIPTIFGYDSLYPLSYLELWRANSQLVKKNQLVVRSPNTQVLAVTGTQTVLTLQPLPPDWRALNTQGRWTLAEHIAPVPPIHAVQRLVASSNPAAIQNINPATEALVTGAVPAIDASALVTIRIHTQEATNLEAEVKTTGSTVVVTNLQWYPGWQARIDEKTAPVLKVNTSFLGVSVPTGTHTISFRYEPTSVRLGALVSGCSVLLLIGGTWLVKRRRRIAPPTRA